MLSGWMSFIGRRVFPGVLVGLLAIAAPGLAQVTPDLDGDAIPDAVDNWACPGDLNPCIRRGP
jgi:hypothetical protein